MWIPILSQMSGVGASKPTAPIPDLSARTYIVTGGHGDGIGFETTKALFNAGAKVIIASRTKSKVQESIDKLLGSSPSATDKERLEFLELDLNSLEKVEGAAKQVLGREKRLDGICANAGIMARPYELTKDGIEESFQANHLGHWLFVTRLLPLLEETGKANGRPARVVNLSSFAHNFISWYPFASPSFSSLAEVNRPFDKSGYIRYSQAKLSAILFSRELNKRCGPHVKSIAVHPGFVIPPLSHLQRSPLYDHLGMSFALRFFIPISEGAISQVYALTSPEVEADQRNLWGAYLVPHAVVKRTTAAGRSEKLAADLWDLCEALTKDVCSE
ncbi:NAD(P)-binding protein [Meredithblackwellia eburnea MCA 4105]